MNENKGQKKILFFAADIPDLKPVKPKKELRKIKRVLSQSRLRQRYQLISVLNATAKKFIRELDRNDNIWMIHYSGHGDKEGALHLKDKNKPFITINTGSLIDQIGQKAPNLKCFFFNSCNSNEIIREVGHLMDYAIGFKGSIRSKLAIKFAEQFYKNFVLSETILFAFWKTKKDLEFEKESQFEVILNFRKENIMKIEEYSDLKKIYTTQKAVIDQKLKNIQVVEQDIDEMTDRLNLIHEGLLADNPIYPLVLWFMENKDSLRAEFVEEICKNESKLIKEVFAIDIEMLFTYVENALANHNYSELSRKHIEVLNLGLDNKLYFSALDLILQSVPDLELYKSSNAIPFLRRVVKHIKSIM